MFFIGFLLLFVAVDATNEATPLKAQHASPNQPQIISKANIPINPAVIETFQNCSGRWDSYCYDCRTIVICAGEEQPIFQGTCPSSEPYCDYVGHSSAQRCVASMQDTYMEQMCNNQPDMITQRCTGYGYYPDVNDARKYYYCDGPGTTYPNVYTCPEDTVFDTKLHNCKRIIPFDCNGKQNEFVLHGTNPAYYAYCRVNGASSEIIPYKCRDDQNFAYNLRTNACEYQCKEEGHFVDRESCEHYYECYRTGNSLSYRRVRCAMMGMEYFSKEQGRCVADNGYSCYPEVGYN
uniref:Chitin-binding type-2 domain-containing protein n=2 Tax=Lutzomyia longipalpis TaxID=7200 RepID=A0A1B0CTK6_LUTLO